MMMGIRSSVVQRMNERGFAVIWTLVIGAVVAGGGATAYVVTDGFGTQTEQSEVVAAAVTPTEEPTTEVTPAGEPTAEVTPAGEPTAEVTPAEEPTTAATPAGEPVAEGPTAKEPVSETDGDHGSAASENPPKSTLPPGLPEGFPDIGVPFYPHAEQTSAVKHSADMYTLSYSSPHELTIVSMFFKHKFIENGWNVTGREVVGSITVTEVEKPGVSLGVAVGPDRIDDTVTNITYTLRLDR